MPTIVARGQITLTKQIGSYTHIKYSEDGKTFSGERPYILTPLPKGYTPCKYLQSNGGYIDTGVMADAPVKMWGVFAGPSAGDYSILAARKGNTRLYLAHVYEGKYQCGYGNLLPIRYNDGGDTAIITRLRADEQFGQCDTTIVQAADAANISLNLSLYLFACNYNGTAAFIAPAETRLTSCKIYGAGFAAQGEIFLDMKRDFLPCLNPEKVAGLYDLVEGKFYTSANDKAFTAVAIDKGDKELIYDSYALNLLDNVESKTNRSYSVATFDIPAHLRGHKLSFSAKVTGELVDGVDVVKKYGVFADAFTIKRKGSFVWPNGLKLCIPDADGYIHYDNLDTGETSVVLYVYTYHHIRIKTKDADNPLVTLSEPMLTVTPAAKPFEPPLKDMRRGTLPAAYMGVYVSENNLPSNNFADYTWTKIKGENGKDGAKGADGRNGVDGKDGTSITPKGQLTSSANLPTTAQKGDSYIIDGFLWVYTGSNTAGTVRGFVNAGSIKGPSGASSYVHIAYSNSADGTVDFTTKDDADDGKTYLFVGICVDTNSTDPTDANKYKWTALAADPVRPNILYQSGFEEGRIDYWQAGQALANTKIDKSICNGRNALTLTGDNGALVAQNIGDRLQPNRWYTLSFYAKVKAGIHVLATGGFIESNAAGGHFAPLPDSTDLDLLSLSPNSDYKFYSVTIKTRPTLPAGDKFLSFTLWGDGSSISMPKLEEGQTATAFMVNENDLKASTPRPCGQWSSNVTYENNRLYIDVVSHNGQYYSCKRTNVGQEPAANSQYWEAANKMKFVATDLLLAERAFIDNLGVRRIATRVNGPRFIAEAGTWAIYGTNQKPSIESWVDDEGNAHLRFNDKDGRAIYDLGPQGVRDMLTSPAFDSIGLSAAMPLGYTDEQMQSKLVEYAAGGLDKVSYSRYYQYHAGKNALTKAYDDKVFVSDTLALSPNLYCPNGRYILKGTAQESEPQFVRDGITYPSALVGGSATVWTIKNGAIAETKRIIWVRTVYK
nr:MAG TPA: Minor structural protein [Caudoviricetes sp.]